jgi:hypothetical protein
MEVSERLKLSLWNTFKHYQISLIGLLGLGASIYRDLINYINGRYTLSQFTEKLSFIHLGILVILGLYTFVQYKRLEFSIINGNFTSTELNEAIKRAKRHLGWRIESRSNKFITATANESDRITIIKAKDKVLINSTTDLSDPKPNYFNYLGDSKNISLFITFLKEVKEGKPAPTYIIKDENQWTTKRFAMRIFVYLFFATPILLIAYDTELMFLIIISLLCLPYICFDLKLVLKQLGEK